MSFFKKIKIKEDRRKRYIIIILLLLIVLIGLGVFLNKINDFKSKKYQSFESEKNTNNKKDVIEEEDVEQEDKKEEETSKEAVEKVESNIVTEEEIEKAKDYCWEHSVYTEMMTDYEKIYNDLKDFTYIKSRKNGYKDFTDDEIKLIGLNGMSCSLFPLNGDKNKYGREYYKFKGSDFINSLKQYFGSNVSFNKNKLVGYENVLGFSVYMGSYIHVISYDSNTDTFKALFGGVGGTSGPQAEVIERKIYSIKEESGGVTIVEKAIYVNFDDYISENNSLIGAKYTIYKDPDKKKKIETKEFRNVDLSEQTISVDDYLDKAATITHKIKLDKNTNNYYFVSSIIE